MSAANDALLVLTPLAYAAAAFSYWHRLGEEGRRLPRALPYLLVLLALGVHGALLVVRGLMIEQLPWTNAFDVLSALAFLMTLTYALVEAASRVPSTGVDLLPLPFVIVTYACAFGPHLPKPNPLTDTPRFVFHTVPAVSALAALLVSGIYGMLYLRLSRAFRRKDFGALFRRLPDLDVLARMNLWAATVGFVLVTLGIFVGARAAGDLKGGVDIRNPKVAMTYVVWTLLLVPMVGRITGRWTDRATAVVSVVTVALIVVSIFVATILYLLR